MQIEIFTGPGCGHCEAAKSLLRDAGQAFVEHDVSAPEALAEFRQRLPRARAIPQIFVDGAHLGGLEDLRLRLAHGTLSASG